MANMHPDALDAALAVINTASERLYICSAQPTTFTGASSTSMLGVKIGPTFGTISNGDVSGRKIVVNAITDGSISATGTATHAALTDDSAGKLMATTTITSQSVTGGNTFTLSAFDIEMPAPAA